MPTMPTTPGTLFGGLWRLLRLSDSPIVSESRIHMPPWNRIRQATGEPPLCSICSQPVLLETCNTDEDGQAVHEQCYVAALSTEHPNDANKN